MDRGELSLPQGNMDRGELSLSPTNKRLPQLGGHVSAALKPLKLSRWAVDR